MPGTLINTSGVVIYLILTMASEVGTNKSHLQIRKLNQGETGWLAQVSQWNSEGTGLWRRRSLFYVCVLIVVKHTEHKTSPSSPCLIVQFVRVKYIHAVVQFLPAALFILQNWNPIPIKQRVRINPATPRPWKPPFSFLSLWIWWL